MLNFDFLGKGLGIVSPPHFVHNFSRKMFLMLYCIKRFFVRVRQAFHDIHKAIDKV